MSLDLVSREPVNQFSIMCGIAGIYEIERGTGLLEDAQLLGSFMTHRGPDNFGSVTLDHAAFAHNRLSLLDLSDAANQPFTNADYALVYNGEIYNFRELRDGLTREFGLSFRTTSDTEVLFYLLIHRGIDRCLNEIQGMFSFAFYDRRRHEMFLARDRHGIKPVYFCQRGGSLYWSSEIKALTRAFNISPNPLKTLMSINGSAERSRQRTLFDNVYSVEPGTYLRFSEGKTRPQRYRYYTPADDIDPELYNRLNRCPRNEVVTEFDRLITQSVEKMLVSDVPVGAFVSGGLDSALLSAIAMKAAGKISLFTANVVGKFSEFDDAKLLSRHIGARLFDHKFHPEDMLRDWAATTYFYECPIIVHTNAIPFSSVSRLANQNGVKAVLTGEGADELFLGYPRLLTQRYDAIATFPLRILKSCYGVVPGLKEYVFNRSEQSSVNFAESIITGFDESIRTLNANGKLDFLRGRVRSEQAIALRLLGEKLAALLHRNDRMGMMASIEARFPYLDEEVVKFGINLPTRFKIGRSVRWHNYKHPFLIDKWIIRALAEKYLPKRIAHKKKSGFPMHGHKDLRVKPDFFRNGWIEDVLRLDRRSQDYMIKTQNPYYLAKIASIEVFGRIFGRQQSVEEVTTHILNNSEIMASTPFAMNGHA